MNLHRKQSAEGLEQTFAVNYLAMFQLTLRLMDRLKASAPARIVNVSSDTYKIAKLELDNLQLERGYSVSQAYGRSKLAIVHFTLELARRLEGTGVTVNADDPVPVSERRPGRPHLPAGRHRPRPRGVHGRLLALPQAARPTAPQPGSGAGGRTLAGERSTDRGRSCPLRRR